MHLAFVGVRVAVGVGDLAVGADDLVLRQAGEREQRQRERQGSARKGGRAEAGARVHACGLRETKAKGHSRRRGTRFKRATRSQRHGLRPCRAARSAASSVLASSIAIVIGPTPPGTGVIRRATSSTPSKSTSPHELAVGVAVHADVDDHRAGLDHVAGDDVAPADRGDDDVGLRRAAPAGRASRCGRW